MKAKGLGFRVQVRNIDLNLEGHCSSPVMFRVQGTGEEH